MVPSILHLRCMFHLRHRAHRAPSLLQDRAVRLPALRLLVVDPVLGLLRPSEQRIDLFQSFTRSLRAAEVDVRGRQKATKQGPDEDLRADGVDTYGVWT